MLIRVSIVAAPWRALTQAARWNGQAPQTATGAARVRASHCQFVNCSAGIIDISATGVVSATEISSRRRRLSTSVSGEASDEASGGAGSSAL